MHSVILISFAVIALAYLCDMFGQFRLLQPAYNHEDNLSLIEHLTRHKTKTKDYQRKPSNFTSFNRKIEGKRRGEDVVFRYEFPLVERHSSVYNCVLEPSSISSDIDSFGMSSSLLDTSLPNYTGLLESVTDKEYSVRMNRDGWYFRDRSDWGVDYASIVRMHRHFTREISLSIYNDLSTKGIDSRLNRVQSALHFVQFIPYGLPHFDTREWCYHGLSLPQESIILGYSDCDSKSILLSSILVDLVPAKDVILVGCEVRSKYERNNGAHMMVAVANMGLNGEKVQSSGRDFLLLETTAPVLMGKADWQELKVTKIIPLI
jgi:hypothetical protein